MVQNYVRKRERENVSHLSILNAVKKVVTKEYIILTLGRYCKTITENELDDVLKAPKIQTRYLKCSELINTAYIVQSSLFVI